jgi:NitT/TauT family transport system substrate-binding protein
LVEEVSLSDHRESWSRREFVRGLTLAGTAGLADMRPGLVAAEPALETSRLRLVSHRGVGVCLAPKFVAADLLLAEGFTDLQYAEERTFAGRMKRLASGDIDIDIAFVAPLIIQIDAGDPILILSGAHVGCLELFGTDRIRTLRDLKGKTVAINEFRGLQHAYLASMVAYVGLDPRKDIRWAVHPRAEAIRLLAENKVDAYICSPPDPQELRAKKIGRVVVNNGLDRPWSQYFCCAVAGNREFVRKHPVATKRALRAILKAADLCAIEPDRVARILVEKGVTTREDYALQTMKEIPYAKWRDYDPEDTVRFYALRLHETGMIASSPQKVLAQGSDWRFLNELKKELKG